MNTDDKLKVVKRFQEQYPDSHLGGSLGLMIHGIDLKRDLSKSDIDITVSNPLPSSVELIGFEESSAPGDFDYNFRCYPEGSSVYVKLDIRYSPEPSYEVINYDGIEYNVSKVRDILFWKQKFADKDIVKHKDDLITIQTGLRPEPIEAQNLSPVDDLPF